MSAAGLRTPEGIATGPDRPIDSTNGPAASTFDPADAVTLHSLPPSIVDLWSRRRKTTAFELMALAEGLKIDTRQAKSVAFDECYAVLRSLPVECVTRVTASPHGLLWLKAFEVSLLATDGEETPSYISVPEGYDRHSAESRRRLTDRIAVYAMAAALHAGEDVSLCSPVEFRGPLSLPRTGFVVTGPRFALRGVRNGRLCVESGVVERTRTVTVRSVSAEIESKDRVIASAAFEPGPKVQDPALLDKFAVALEEAVRLILCVVPDAEPELAESLRCVVPIANESGSFRSGTVSLAPGLMYMSVTFSSLHIVDMLIHEMAHSSLFLVQAEDPLLAPNRHGDGWGPPMVYSPWRDDPRPLNGLLHACYVFWRVARFWIDAIRHNRDDCSSIRNFALRRLAALAVQLEAGMTELSRASHWTPGGSRFQAALMRGVDAVRLEALSLGATGQAPIYANQDGLDAGIGSAAERQETHRRRWYERYADL